MAIRLICQGCSGTLTVPDEHAGKKALCPSCQAVNAIPASSLSPATDSNLRPHDAGSQEAVANSFEKPILPKSELSSPYAAPMAYADQVGVHQGAHLQPHRGGLVLTLGILSLFCNFFLLPGIFAWVFGQGDLKKMNAGQMDRSGYGTTQAGMILGIIATCLFFLVIVLYVVMILFVIIVGAASAAAGSLHPIV